MNQSQERTDKQTSAVSTYSPIQEALPDTRGKQFVLLYGAIAGSLLFTSLLLAGIVGNWHTFISTANLFLQVLLLLCVVLFPLLLISVCLFSVLRAVFSLLQTREAYQAMQDERRRLNERHHMELYLLETRLPADQNGNRAAIYHHATDALLVPPSGNYPQPVPTHYAPRFDYQDSSTRMIDEEQPAFPPRQPLHLPPFGQLLSSGEISPGMHDILLCFELLTDELTGQVMGYEPYRDRLENHSTLFLAGASKSGKTTLMAHVSAQQALLNAAFYLIDPHLMHPEKSLARKLAPLSPAFILPPAMSDAEIFSVLAHAKAEMQARIDGRETALSGRPIVFLVDEVLAVLARAQRTQNKEVIALYRDFALFLRDLGTQYAKWQVSGVLASQYVTKDAFSLPGGKIDFRDGCHNQIILRLPPNQAQALRLLEPQALRSVRRLPPGQGYMGLSTGELLHMGIGEVTVADMQEVGRMVSAIASANSFQKPCESFAKDTGSHTTSRTSQYAGDEEQEALFPPIAGGRDTPGNTLHKNGTKAETAGAEVTSERASDTFQKQAKAGSGKALSPEQELQFLSLYQKRPNINEALKEMNLGTGYYSAAAAVVARFNLRHKRSSTHHTPVF